MWKESDKKLVVRLGSSPPLSALLLLMHLGAWASILIVPMSWYSKALLVIVVGISLRGSLLAHGLRQGSGAIVELELQENDCAVRLANMAPWIPCSLAGHFVHPWLVVLRLKMEGRRWPVNVVVVRGAAGEPTFRQLRVRLNHS